MFLLRVHSSYYGRFINPLSASHTKWSNTLKKFVDILLKNCLSVFDHFVKLALKGLRNLRKLLGFDLKNKYCFPQQQKYF